MRLSSIVFFQHMQLKLLVCCYFHLKNDNIHHTHTFRAAVIFPPLFRDAAVVDVIIIVTFFCCCTTDFATFLVFYKVAHCTCPIFYMFKRLQLLSLPSFARLPSFFSFCTNWNFSVIRFCFHPSWQCFFAASILRIFGNRPVALVIVTIQQFLIVHAKQR